VSTATDRVVQFPRTGHSLDNPRILDVWIVVDHVTAVSGIREEATRIHLVGGTTFDVASSLDEVIDALWRGPDPDDDIGDPVCVCRHRESMHTLDTSDPYRHTRCSHLGCACPEFHVSTSPHCAACKHLLGSHDAAFKCMVADCHCSRYLTPTRSAPLTP
jgi:hypothetical protein